MLGINYVLYVLYCIVIADIIDKTFNYYLHKCNTVYHMYIMCVYVATVYVTVYAKTVPIGTTIEIHFRA